MRLNNKGLTLVELLISIILVGIVLSFLFQLLIALKDETEYNDFAFNNQVNRLEVIYAVQSDLSQYVLTGVEDASEGDNFLINFYFQKDGEPKEAFLKSEKKPKDSINEDRYYLSYTNVEGITTTWLMKNATIDKCGNFTYLKDSNNYYFILNLLIYNSIYNEKNNSNFNNIIDDIGISYAGNSSNLSNNNDYLTNSVSGDKQIGNCTN